MMLKKETKSFTTCGSFNLYFFHLHFHPYGAFKDISGSIRVTRLQHSTLHLGKTSLAAIAVFTAKVGIVAVTTNIATRAKVAGGEIWAQLNLTFFYKKGLRTHQSLLAHQCRHFSFI